MDRRGRITMILVAASIGLGCATTTTADPVRSKMGAEEVLTLRKQLVYALANHREWAATLKPLIELSAQNPKDSDVRTLLATAYREEGLFEQARAAYKEAIRLNPRNAGAYGGRGILREVSGEAGDAALDDFRMATRLAPRDAAHWNNLGFALWARGSDQQAEAALQEGLRYDPLSRRMRNNLGFVYGRLGQYDRARREFEHSGTEDKVENNLGYVYEQAGDLQAACVHYRSALASNPLLQVALGNAQRACGESTSRKGRTP